MSHLGRPKGKVDPKYSLKPIAARLSELLGKPVPLAPDCVGPEVEAMAHALQPGEVLLLENLRFHPEEEANDPGFARQLAALGDVYVNDAFGTAHRAHASTEGVAHDLPAVAGFLMEKELTFLGGALEHPKRPFVAISGGAKVSDKIAVLDHLIDVADKVLIGGGMANTFFKAHGLFMGDSLVEDDKLEDARRLMAKAEAAGKPFILPVDVAVGEKFAADAEGTITTPDAVPEGWRILDVGPQTISGLWRGARRREDGHLERHARRRGVPRLCAGHKSADPPAGGADLAGRDDDCRRWRLGGGGRGGRRG